MPGTYDNPAPQSSKLMPDPATRSLTVGDTGTSGVGASADLTHPDVVTTEQAKGSTGRRLKVPATLKLTHKAIGAEVRRGTYDALVDGKPVGSVEMNDTIEIPVEPGRHTLQVRNGRNSSRTETFDAADGEVVAFRCTGKRFLPIFLASFVFPSLALSLRRE
jgi:hypothetical protein